ncbi:hypothetical protein C8R47DRAFT_749072 [Mycena vitilis]|nr:hypothetical protein C8R47DRAFT_749072 [Mycena vitilis]
MQSFTLGLCTAQLALSTAGLANIPTKVLDVVRESVSSSCAYTLRALSIQAPLAVVASGSLTSTNNPAVADSPRPTLSILESEEVTDLGDSEHVLGAILLPPGGSATSLTQNPTSDGSPPQPMNLRGGDLLGGSGVNPGGIETPLTSILSEIPPSVSVPQPRLFLLLRLLPLKRPRIYHVRRRSHHRLRLHPLTPTHCVALYSLQRTRSATERSDFSLAESGLASPTPKSLDIRRRDIFAEGTQPSQHCCVGRSFDTRIYSPAGGCCFHRLPLA